VTGRSAAGTTGSLAAGTTGSLAAGTTGSLAAGTTGSLAPHLPARVVPRVTRGIAPRITALVAAMLIGLLPAVAAPVAAAGTVTFGDPSATSVFGTGITFSQPISGPGVEARYVEILITRPGSAGPEVYPIPHAGTIASSTFEYRMREADQHIYPNTKLTARWRVVDTAGTVSVGPPTTITYMDTRFDWQTATGSVVRVHWYKGDEAFGRRALAIGEAGVARAEELLGVTETEPVDFFVYADLEAFYDALGPGTRENVGGEALTGIRTLFGLITPDQIAESWVGIVIPHELTHLVFDTAVQNPYHFPPHWLNEGLAVYLTQGYDAGDRQLVRNAVRAAEIIPLPGLDGQFPTRRDKFALAYAESVSAIDFMVRTYGRDGLVKLISSYATGVTDDNAFSGALGVNARAFNDAWLAEIGAATPLPHGPLPDPAGPLPSGWTSSPVTAAPASPGPPGSAAPASGNLASALPSPTASGGAPASGGPQASGGAPTSGGVSASAPLPTLAGGPASAPAAPSAPTGSLAPLPTPGSVPDEPVAAGGTTTESAWLFGLVAIALAAVGIGLLARRRRSSALR